MRRRCSSPLHNWKEKTEAAQTMRLSNEIKGSAKLMIRFGRKAHRRMKSKDEIFSRPSSFSKLLQPFF